MCIAIIILLIIIAVIVVGVIQPWKSNKGAWVVVESVPFVSCPCFWFACLNPASYLFGVALIFFIIIIIFFFVKLIWWW